MFVDLQPMYSSGEPVKLLLVRMTGGCDELRAPHPYFYLLEEPGRAREAARLLAGTGAFRVEATRLRAVVHMGERYRVSGSARVYRVYCRRVRDVPVAAERLRRAGYRCGAFNVKYAVRAAFDTDARFLDVEPLYRGLDESFTERLADVRILVMDIEVWRGRVLVGLLPWRMGEEPRHGDAVQLWLPDEADEFRRLLGSHGILLGHNLLGFDLPELRRRGLMPQWRGLVLDTSVSLQQWGNAMGVGAARSLYDVARVLRDEAGITRDELEGKKVGDIESLPRGDLLRYNANDLVLTAKIAKVVAGFILAASALFQVPASTLMQLPAGMVAEYYLLRRMELEGYVPEYREIEARLSAGRVFVEREGARYKNVLQLDVKAMYPSYVLHFKVDPTLRARPGTPPRFLDDVYREDAGPGFLYRAVRDLYALRMETKKLKKRNPGWAPVDKAVKAVLNALAYGVQAKSSGPAIMGNPWCPSRIFYGTLEAQEAMWEAARRLGYRPVYSDTDSVFLVKRDGSPWSSREVEETVSALNKVLGRYGLVLDVEGVWREMLVVKPKNYVLRGNGEVVVKGGALRRGLFAYLPECIVPEELLDGDPARYVEEKIASAPPRELMARSTQMLWRLVGLDPQYVKRHRNGSRHLVAESPWEEPERLVLKTGKGGHLLAPGSNVLVYLLCAAAGWKQGRRLARLPLRDMNPFGIHEALWLPGEALGLRRCVVFMHGGGLYRVGIGESWYRLRSPETGAVVRVPTRYTAAEAERYSGWRLEAVEAVVEISGLDIGWSEVRRRLTGYVLKKLREYGLIGGVQRSLLSFI